MKTQYLCLPLMRPTSRTTTATTTKQSPSANQRVLSPSASFTEKLREAVFRLIMVTALSKNNTTNKNKSNNNNSSTSSRLSKAEYHDYHSQSVRSSYYLHDPYSGQAVADCIEFMKKNSASSSPFDLRFHHHEHDDDCEDSKRESSVVADIIIPLPVM